MYCRKRGSINVPSLFLRYFDESAGQKGYDIVRSGRLSFLIIIIRNLIEDLKQPAYCSIQTWHVVAICVKMYRISNL